MGQRELSDERDEVLVMGRIRQSRRGLTATEIALAATQFQRRPGIKHLKWLGTKIADRMIAKGKLVRQGDRFVVR